MASFLDLSGLRYFKEKIDTPDIVKHIFFNKDGASRVNGSLVTHDITVQDNMVGFYFAAPLVARYVSTPYPYEGSPAKIQTIAITMDTATSSQPGCMSATQASQLSSLYSAHNGKTYLPTSGGTMTGKLTCRGGLDVSLGTCDIRNGLDLYYTTPYIDFHYNRSTADYTSKIVESSSGTLNVNGVQFSLATGLKIPESLFATYQGWLANSYINNTGSGAACCFKQYTNNDNFVIARDAKANANKGDHSTDDEYFVYMAMFDNKNITLSGSRVTINGTDGSISCPKVTQTSDKRLKENIYPISTDIEKINDIEFKEFNLVGDTSGRKSYGVLAQDLENVGLNDLVYENEEGIKSVDYTALIMLELQRLRNEVKNLKQEIETLKSSNV